MIVDFSGDLDPFEYIYCRAVMAMGEPLASLWLENFMTLLWVKSPTTKWYERPNSEDDMTANGKATPAKVKAVISDFSRIYKTDP